MRTEPAEDVQQKIRIENYENNVANLKAHVMLEKRIRIKRF